MICRDCPDFKLENIETMTGRCCKTGFPQLPECFCELDEYNNVTCKGCIHNMGNLTGADDIYCEYIEDYINNTRCEYYEEDNNNG